MRRFAQSWVYVLVAVGLSWVGIFTGAVGASADAGGGFSLMSGSPFATGGLDAQQLAIGDLNGDGRPDVVVANFESGAGYSGTGTGMVGVLLGDASRGFVEAPGAPISIPGAAVGVAIRDFNGDGKPDLAVLTQDPSGVDILLGDGSGGFTQAPGSPIVFGSQDTSMAVADFNGDGKQDIVVADGPTLWVLLGDGNGDFTLTSGSLPLYGGGDELAVGDVNGDGKPDLVAPTATHVAVLLGDGHGRFTPAPGSPFATGDNNSAFVAIGDLNGDGRPDLAVSNDDGTFSLLLGDGAGGFTAAAGSPFATGGWANSRMAIGDLNGDGYPDLAFTSTSGPGSTQDTLRVLFGNGRGNFIQAPGSPYATGDSWAYASIGDLNGDSRPDLAVLGGGTSQGQLSVFLANPYPAPVAPQAELTVAPNPVPVGVTVRLDASGSTDSVGTITDYQWDMGSGSFSQDTGATPTATTSFSSPGSETVRVKVTNSFGQSSVASATVTVPPTPPPGPVGVSINNGDYATNNPAVELSVVWPADASQALISNDGGFGAAGDTESVPVAATIPWTLRSQSGERLSKTVYLRFPDSPDPLITFTDDIVLDTTTPVLQSATTSTASTSQQALRTMAAVGTGHLFKVRIRASETRSGISRAQFSPIKHGGTVVVLRNRKVRGITKLSRVVPVTMKRRPRFVRVRSAAGNWSRWHRIK